jgi:hypothetical protein
MELCKSMELWGTLSQPVKTSLSRLDVAYYEETVQTTGNWVRSKSLDYLAMTY